MNKIKSENKKKLRFLNFKNTAPKKKIKIPPQKFENYRNTSSIYMSWYYQLIDF